MLKIIETVTLLESLTFINMFKILVTLECMEILSHRPFLKTINFISCHFFHNENGQLHQFEFSKSLKNFQMTGYGYKSMSFELVNCKQLNSFKFHCGYKNTEWLVKFLNQLDHCNELEIEVDTWSSSVELKPKFL